MVITKFLRVSKKRDLSDQLDKGEQQKIVREGSLEEKTEINSVFKNSMDLFVCEMLRKKLKSDFVLFASLKSI